jgi:hypothetical protein
MAGPAPTDFQFTRTLDAGPVHCNVWLCFARRHSPCKAARNPNGRRKQHGPKQPELVLPLILDALQKVIAIT